MAEVNNGNPKYRKHLDSIGGASVLALEYMRSPVIPRPLSEYNDKLTYIALDMEPPAEPVSGRAQNVETGAPSRPVGSENPTIGNEKGRRKSPKRRRSTNPQTGRNSDSIIAAGVGDTKQSGIDAGQRPRRRRKKSTRYEGFNDPFMIDARNGKLKDAHDIVTGGRQNVGDAQASTGIAGESSDTARGQSVAPRVLLTLPLNGLLQNKSISEWKLNGNTTATIKSLNSVDEKMDAKQPVGNAVTINKSNPLKLRINGAAMHSGQKPGPSSPKLTRKSMKPVAKNLLSSLVKKPNGTPKSRKRKSPSQNSSRIDEVDTVQHIPMEASHAKENKNTMNDTQTPHPCPEDTASSSKETDDHAVLPPTCDADDSAAVEVQAAPEQTSAGSAAREASVLGASPPPRESMHELNNRMRSLEGHIQSLQVRVGRGRNVASGENASAAALKTAVQNMARAAHAFARSRGYETRTIAAGVDALWPQTVASAEGTVEKQKGRKVEFVRSIAKSLVWAASEQQTRI